MRSADDYYCLRRNANATILETKELIEPVPYGMTASPSGEPGKVGSGVLVVEIKVLAIVGWHAQGSVEYGSEAAYNDDPEQPQRKKACSDYNSPVEELILLVIPVPRQLLLDVRQAVLDELDGENRCSGSNDGWGGLGGGAALDLRLLDGIFDDFTAESNLLLKLVVIIDCLTSDASRHSLGRRMAVVIRCEDI